MSALIIASEQWEQLWRSECGVTAVFILSLSHSRSAHTAMDLKPWENHMKVKMYGGHDISSTGSLVFRQPAKTCSRHLRSIRVRNTHAHTRAPLQPAPLTHALWLQKASGPQGKNSLTCHTVRLSAIKHFITPQPSPFPFLTPCTHPQQTHKGVITRKHTTKLKTAIILH